MAGIYVHIPFCKTRCIYCGFYSTTLSPAREYITAVLREHALRSDYLRGEPLETIYIGGGTPSQLPPDELERLIGGLLNGASVGAEPLEITIEMNPDDVTAELAERLRRAGVNRVSMGVQTFSDERLRFLHRRHTAAQARAAVATLRAAGFTNISLDLMFGFSGQTLNAWDDDITQALALQPQHLSAYALTYEEGTPLWTLRQQGSLSEISDDLSRAMYYHLVDRLCSAGYQHYELSNFALPGYHSRHNSSYWNATPYLGLGAAAHSFNRQERSWNVSDVSIYINKVLAGERPADSERLSATDRYNDMIVTTLRTAKGIRLDSLNDSQRHYLLTQAQPLIDRNLLALTNTHLHLTREGLFVSDAVMTELILVE